MVPDAVIMLLVQDNIDLASGTIEKAAMDRAVAEVDEGFAGAYDARRRHRQVCILSCLVLPAGCSFESSSSFFRQTAPRQPFWDSNALPSAFSASLPDPLRIKVNGVQPNQIGVYEDFGMFFGAFGWYVVLHVWLIYDSRY